MLIACAEMDNITTANIYDTDDMTVEHLSRCDIISYIDNGGILLNATVRGGVLLICDYSGYCYRYNNLLIIVSSYNISIVSSNDYYLNFSLYDGDLRVNNTVIFSKIGACVLSPVYVYNDSLAIDVYVLGSRRTVYFNDNIDSLEYALYSKSVYNSTIKRMVLCSDNL